MSAGEFFDLIRPVVLVLSALLSTWVLASARQRGFPTYLSTAWALGTLFFPPIVFPLYLIARSFAKLREQTLAGSVSQNDLSRPATAWGVRVPLVYATVVLSVIAIFFYRDYQTVDSHLARAAHARVNGERGRTISEYRAVLKREDNPHTHKLLAIELADAGDWTEAAAEFRLAERGGEPDDSIPFRIASLLDSLNHASEATVEYQRFLSGQACTQPLPDYRCETARRRMQTSTHH